MKRRHFFQKAGALSAGISVELHHRFNDKNHELEKRERWPETGHTQTTINFHREVFAARNLLGVFAGHVHRQTVDVVRGIPQYLTHPNAAAGFLEVDFLPLKPTYSSHHSPD